MVQEPGRFSPDEGVDVVDPDEGMAACRSTLVMRFLIVVV